eukprot:TRINITY_DN3029_c0_g1_i2.p1 TRINITY_DN3029_c0_g1~~TRINITY_DN3029_c0_g1_i2.p1  ORF type:complete len:142 (+),score=33.72 TRINITY_DN3029_c0_g1_i2:93-518(+)
MDSRLSELEICLNAMPTVLVKLQHPESVMMYESHSKEEVSQLKEAISKVEDELQETTNLKQDQDLLQRFEKDFCRVFCRYFGVCEAADTFFDIELLALQRTIPEWDAFKDVFPFESFYDYKNQCKQGTHRDSVGDLLVCLF